MNIKIYKNILQEVDTNLTEILQEFSDSISILHNDERFVRTRLLIAFSLLEIICNLYNAYFNLSLSNQKLLEKWIKEYCLKDENPTYKRHAYMKSLTASHLYKFRNSIIHAFGLPEPENGLYITVPNGFETADVIKKMDENFRRLGHNIAFISADSLVRLFIDGFTLMYPEIFKDVTIANQDDLEGLERINKEFGRRGAKGIPLTI